MTTRSSTPNSNSAGKPSDASKEEYSSPEVEHYGTLTELTRGPSGGTLDQLFGGDGGFEDGGGGMS